MWAIAIPLTTGLVGCEMLQSLLSLDALSVLGIIPQSGFSKASADGFGKVVFAVAAEDEGGFSLAPPVSMLEFRDQNGDLMGVRDNVEVPGNDAGTFALLVDGSGSMTSTDEERFRVDAAAMVASRIEACSDQWDQALLEFNSDSSGGKYEYSQVLAPYGSSAKAIAESATALDAGGGTPLWDATHEVLAAFADHADSHSQRLLDAGEPTAETYGRALVVISDGADTSSSRRLSKVIEKANNKGISVHAIGLGPASDAETSFLREDKAITELRRLALETGGTYGYVSSADELPAQADAIASAVCNGYTQVIVEMADPPASGERVRGFVGIAGTPIGLPYTFTAP
jgi:hypothetical protein